MLRIQQHILRYGLVSHKICHNGKDYHKDPTLHFVIYLFIFFKHK
jgi:hypothetical protein